MTFSKLIQYYKAVATSILAIQLTIGTTRLLMNVTGNIYRRRHVIHTDVYQNYIIIQTWCYITLKSNKYRPRIV